MFRFLIVGWLGASVVFAQEDGGIPTGPGSIFAIGADQTEATKVNDAIYLAYGFGNTFMVVTDEGNVIVDTALPQHAPRSKRLLQAVNDGPVNYIILTHGHGDHRGGVATWKEDRTEVIAQENYVEFLHYQHRLGGYFARANAAQFQGRIPPGVGGAVGENYGAEIDATILFDERHTFHLGGITFDLHHTPGETYDHLSVWIPQFKAAFVGDNFYGSFPNIYTLRGTQPRWALDYVESLDKVLSWEPEILLPSHGPPVFGNAAIVEEVTRYRDAILAVHDATINGMNQGKDVFTLMQEIALPPELEVGEAYGNLPWSIRGIFEGYVGWFDGQPSNMYSVPPAAVYPNLVTLAGGADAVAEEAKKLFNDGKTVEALRLADIAIEAEPGNKAALEVRLSALQTLFDRAANSNERGWLHFGIEETKRKLGQ